MRRNRKRKRQKKKERNPHLHGEHWVELKPGAGAQAGSHTWVHFCNLSSSVFPGSYNQELQLGFLKWHMGILTSVSVTKLNTHSLL